MCLRIILKVTKKVSSSFYKIDLSKNLSGIKLTPKVVLGLTTIISKTQESYIHLFVINHLISNDKTSNTVQKKIIFLKTFDLEFSYFEVWFTD